MNLKSLGLLVLLALIVSCGNAPQYSCQNTKLCFDKARAKYHDYDMEGRTYRYFTGELEMYNVDTGVYQVEKGMHEIMKGSSSDDSHLLQVSLLVR